jgi:oligopeptidase B
MTTDRRSLLASTATALALSLVPAPLLAAQRKRKAMIKIVPPVAKRIAHSSSRHGITLVDPYYWLKDQGYPKVDDAPVLAYLKEENAYFAAVMDPHKAVTEKLFAELKARVKEDDSSVPQKDGAFLYQTRYSAGEQYPRLIRWPIGNEKAETVLLDQPALAKGKDYFRLSGGEVSNNDKLIAYATDTSGAERFVTRIKEIESGTHLPEELPETNGSLVWQADDKAFAYMELSPEWRPYRVRLHVLGTDPKTDKILFEEKDTGFFCGLGQTQSKKYMLIQTGNNITSEVHLVPTDNLSATPLLVSGRRANHEYDLDEREGTLYIRTNDAHKNFRIVTAPAATPQEANWKELVAGSDRHYLRGLTSFKNRLVVQERVDGLDQIRLRDYDGNQSYIKFPEASYSATVASNPDYELGMLRVTYASMITPSTVYDYDIVTAELVSRKVQEIPSGYDKNLYATERLMAPARDGTLVPVSIVYRKDRGKNKGPLHLYAYGSYGYAIPPGFSTIRLSLLDRGFAYAIAHIRGGDDLGYDWYLQGKTNKRWNTFNDFIDVGKFLVAEGYTATKNISAEGGSAGGQVMGVITNAAPELWRAVIADVPFVDVMNTMQDESLPLTPTEWQEWGNPIKSAADFNYMLSYSPYENVGKKDYPHLYITGGLNDPRVTYWEPAKWTARLRHEKTNDNLLLLKINMGAGHGGKSGRFDSLYEDAQSYTFLLKAYGLI